MKKTFIFLIALLAMAFSTTGTTASTAQEQEMKSASSSQPTTVSAKTPQRLHWAADWSSLALLAQDMR